MKKGKNTRCPVKNWATWSANAYFFPPFGFLFLPPLLEPQNHEMAPIFIQFFFSLSLFRSQKSIHHLAASRKSGSSLGQRGSLEGAAGSEGRSWCLEINKRRTKHVQRSLRVLHFFQVVLLEPIYFPNQSVFVFFFSPNLSFLKSRRSTSCFLFFSFFFYKNANINGCFYILTQSRPPLWEFN